MDDKLKEIAKHKQAIESIIYDIVKEDSNISFDIMAMNDVNILCTENARKEDFQCLFLKFKRSV